MPAPTLVPDKWKELMVVGVDQPGMSEGQRLGLIVLPDLVGSQSVMGDVVGSSVLIRVII